MQTERRALPIEIRAKGRRLEGYAAVFGSPTEIGGKAGFTETIRAGAFSRTLKAEGAAAANIIAMVDHDPRQVLARTRSGTLRLAEDSRGLHFDLDLPETTYASDLLAIVERGDAGGASFGFTVPAGGDEWSGKARVLKDVDLREISIVSAWPAYEDTIVFARSAIPGKPPSRVLFARKHLDLIELEIPL